MPSNQPLSARAGSVGFSISADMHDRLERAGVAWLRPGETRIDIEDLLDRLLVKTESTATPAAHLSDNPAPPEADIDARAKRVHQQQQREAGDLTTLDGGSKQSQYLARKFDVADEHEARARAAHARLSGK